MSIDTEIPKYTKSALEFKSTSFSVPILVVFNADLVQLEHQIKQKIAQAPEFFKNSPVLIDLHNCNNIEQIVDIAGLIKYLQKNKLFPVGICGGNEEQNHLAIKLNIPVHTLRGTHSTNKKPSKKLSAIDTEETIEINTNETATSAVENMLISHPVRSGQRIYAKGDLTILSHVSAGAEIMAEGSIHVYGDLRGRALAGVQGNIESRIFCSGLYAELVSIDGHYKISEEIDNGITPGPTQIYLQNQTLIIKNL